MVSAALCRAEILLIPEEYANVGWGLPEYWRLSSIVDWSHKEQLQKNYFEWKGSL